MIIKKSLFSVPIYICSLSDFSDKRKNKRREAEKLSEDSFIYKKFGVRQEVNLEKDFWKYDKIIGWIEIYLNDQTLKADYWFVSAKKVSINLRKKKIEYSDKIADVSMTHRKSNAEIKEDIKFFFSNCQKGKFLKKLNKYFIDTSEFYQLLEYLDIKKLIEDLTQKNKKRTKCLTINFQISCLQ